MKSVEEKKVVLETKDGMLDVILIAQTSVQENVAGQVESQGSARR